MYTEEQRQKINQSTHLACGEYCNSLEEAKVAVKEYASRTSYHSQSGDWHCYTKKQVSSCGTKVRNVDFLENSKTREKEKRVSDWENCVQTF